MTITEDRLFEQMAIFTGKKKKNFHYASVSMDNWSTQGFSTLHFVVESPLTNLKSYPFYAIRMDGGKAKDYIKSIPRGLRHLQLAETLIGSIVVDGNTTQLKALSPTYKKLFYNQ